MIFTGISYLAVIAAAVAAYAFGAIWYMLLAKPWLAAVGFTEPPKPAPAPFVIAFVAQLVIAYFLAGLIGHLGDVTVARGIVTAWEAERPRNIGSIRVTVNAMAAQAAVASATRRPMNRMEIRPLLHCGELSVARGGYVRCEVLR